MNENIKPPTFSHTLCNNPAGFFLTPTDPVYPPDQHFHCHYITVSLRTNYNHLSETLAAKGSAAALASWIVESAYVH